MRAFPFMSFVLLLMSFSNVGYSKNVSEGNPRYKDYHFDYMMIGYKRTASSASYVHKNISDSDKVLVNDWFSKKYNIPAKEVFNYGGLGIWFYIDKNLFIIAGELSQKGMAHEIKNILLADCEKNVNANSKIKGKCHERNYLAVLDLNKERIIALPYEWFAEKTNDQNSSGKWEVLNEWRSKERTRFLTSPVVGSMSTYPHSEYGCLAPKYFGKADINLDGEYELILVTSGGFDDLGADRGTSGRGPEFTYAYFYLTFLKLTANGVNVIFDQELVSREVQYGSNESLQSINGPDGNGGGVIRRSKLFFNDYDNDGALEVFYWQKYFDVSYVQWKEKVTYKGQMLKRFILKHDDEFIPADDKIESADDIIRKYNLEWDKGFPDNDMCD